MATPYEKVYERFLARITDFNLAELDDYTLNKMLRTWLSSAIVRTRTLDATLVCDDENECFNNDLSELDIELLGLGMTLAWLDQTLNSTELTLMMLGGKEEKLRQYLPTVRCTRKLCSVSL